MSVLKRMQALYYAAEGLAPDLPTEKMFLRFSQEVVANISAYVEELEEAEE